MTRHGNGESDGSGTVRGATVSPIDLPWPSDGIETLGRCPICAESHRSLLHGGLQDLVFRCAPGRWDLWRCGSCRNAYLDPRPSASAIILAYGNYYTHDAPTERPPVRSRLGACKRALANGYRNWRFGGALQPANPLGIPLFLAIPRLKAAIDLSLRHLPRLGQGGGELLDVGCGNGQFLKEAKNVGWSARGCDFDPVAVATASAAGFEVRQGGIEAWADAEGRFDAITLNHVIEHVHDPLATIDAAWKLLKQGGSIFIETPNIDARGHRSFGRAWRGLEPPRHLVLFHPRGLENALARRGFTALRRLPRPGVYAGMAAQSAAIREGQDPVGARSSQARLVDRLIELLAPARGEFISLVARKPERASP